MHLTQLHLRNLIAVVTVIAFAQSTPAQWTAVGTGMNDKVEAVWVIDGPGPFGGIYAGGTFTMAGGQSRNHIARWDGAAWRNVGGGINGPVKALFFHQGNLYAGGSFTQAGNAAAKNIARWDGSSWRKLGSGTNGTVFALGNQGTSLVAGGNFTQAGGNSAKYVALWNGTAWSSMHTGMNGPVYALCNFNGKIHAGGDFTKASGLTANRLARWNGSSWVRIRQNSSLTGGFGTGNGVNGIVFALATDGVNLYIGGAFTTAGGTTVNFIVGWTGTAWFALGVGTNGTVRTIVAMGPGIVCVGGLFTQAGGLTSKRMAVFWVNSWISQPALNAAVLCMFYYQNLIYAGGSFTAAGGLPMLRFGRIFP